jgi:hypothetical protein
MIILILLHFPMYKYIWQDFISNSVCTIHVPIPCSLIHFVCLEILFPFVPLSPVPGDKTLSDPTSLDLAGAETVLSIGNAIGLVLPADPPIVSRLVEVDKSGVRFTEFPDPTESIVELL